MSLQDLLNTALPMNRKERFFTGTVLPMVVCAGNFAHFDRFLKLVGAPDLPVIADPDSANVQLFTEYGFAESLMAAARFPTVPVGRDTPDFVVLIRGKLSVLVAVEAKMFYRPTLAELNAQLQNQRRQIDAIAYDLPGEVEVRHIALMPKQLQDAIGELAADTVTWQQVVKDFHDVAPPYWMAILRLALEGYETYAGPEATFGKNADARMLGGDILRLHRSRGLEYPWMGRAGGLHAPAMTDDISTGRWRTQTYEVRRTPLQSNPNWFLVRDFITLLERDVPVDTGPWTVEDLMHAWSSGALSFSDLVLRLTAVRLEPAADPSYDDPSGIPGPNHFYPVATAHVIGELNDHQHARLTQLWQPASHPWAVSLALVAWPDEANWAGSLMHHFDNWTMRDPLVCLDFIESWSLQGSKGQLPLYGVGVPVEVHGFVGVQGAHGFAPVAQWTPRIIYSSETPEAGRPRKEAEDELRRFQADPRHFRPDRSAWGMAEGYWNKLHMNRELGSDWYIDRLIDQAYSPGEQ